MSWNHDDWLMRPLEDEWKREKEILEIENEFIKRFDHEPSDFELEAFEEDLKTEYEGD